MSEPIDDGVLQDMSTALSQGRRVRFSPGGEPTASLETADGMSQVNADFLGTKVDDINGLLTKGLEVVVDPDGSIFAYNADRSERYLASPDASLDIMERMTVHDAIRKGAHVVIETDGSIAYQIAKDAVPPPDSAAAARIAHFNQQVDGGDLGAAAASGKQFEIAADGTMSYLAMPGDPAGGDAAGGGDATGGGTPIVQDAFEERLQIDAAEAHDIAGRVRTLSYDRFVEENTNTALERDEQARSAWALRQEAAAADMQVKREQLAFDKATDGMETWREAAEKGDDAIAVQMFDRFRAQGEVANMRLDRASSRARDAREQAEAADQEVKRLELEMKVDEEEYNNLLEDTGALLVRAEMLDEAVVLEDQADALDEKAARLRAAGDETGAAAAEAEALAAHDDARSKADIARQIDVNTQAIENLGIDLPDDFEDPLTPATTSPDGAEGGEEGEPGADGETAPGETAPGETPPPTVIDFEPDVIESGEPEASLSVPEIEMDPAATDFDDSSLTEEMAGIEQVADQLDDPWSEA